MALAVNLGGMKAFRQLLPILLCVGAMLFVGCKSTPKPDWNSRVGNYTYDQAVTELGPPDASTKLTDGKIVADWIKRNHTSFSFGVGTGFYGGHGGVGVGQGVAMTPGDKVLRLIFAPDGKLESWSKN